MDGPAGAAAMLGPMDADDPDGGRNPVQHLAGRDADLVQGPAAVRAGGMVMPDRDVFTGTAYLRFLITIPCMLKIGP